MMGFNKRQQEEIKALKERIAFLEKQNIEGDSRDVSRRKSAERRLRENEQRMALYFDQSPLGVIEWDLNFKVKTWNPSAEKIFGYSEEEAIGKHASFIVPMSDRAHVDQVWMELIMLKGGGRSTNKNIRKNGDFVYCDWYNTPLNDEKGNVVAAASLVEDITHRIRAEQIQKAVYNISNSAYAAGDLNKLIGEIQEQLSTIIDTTNFFVALYDETSDSITLPFFEDEMDQFTAMPAGKSLTGHVIKTGKPLLANKEVSSDLESRGIIESIGTDCEIWLGVPLKVDEKVIGALVVQSYKDENAYNESDLKMLEFVSEQIGRTINRKRTEVELQKALEKAKEADRLKSAFLANMSHEIRTPMNGILGFADLLKNPDITENEKQKYIDLIEKSGSRMLGIINDLIDISKIESKQSKITTTELNLNEALKFIHSFFAPEAESRNLGISFSSGLKDEKSWIKSDKEMLYAILINLVKNAIKYSKAGEINFGYTKESKNLRFFVADEGIGIPSDRLPTVFDRFVQVESELTGINDGTGLGLSIAKAYVELLGGKIWVESVVDEGSTFYFEIPHVPAQKKIETSREKEPRKEATDGRKLNIVLAEDDDILRKYTGYVLKRISNRIVTTGTGAETIEAIRNNPDTELVLMDIRMPGMDGYDATREIRKFNKDVVIIAQTAFASENDREKALAAGCNDYVSKPIDRKLLLEKIGEFFPV